MIRAATIAAALALTAPAVAGPFDDLSDADRAALHAEIRQYLMENPEIILEAVRALEARQAEEQELAAARALDANRALIFDDPNSYVGGNPDGDITIVEFFDYQCGFCKRAHPEIEKLLEEDGNIRLVYKEFPILGPASVAASRAALAVFLEQPDAYAAFSDLLMRHDGPMTEVVIDALARDAGVDVAAMRARIDDPAITEIIDTNRQLAQALGITGTPTFIVETEFIRGYLPFAQLQERVAAHREDS